MLKDPTLSNQPILITEGEMDALSCIQAGHVRTVSIPDGWTVDFETGDERKSKPLMRNLSALKGARVIVAGDNDPVGESLARFVSNLLEDQVVLYVRWPDGCKDANDTLRDHGPGAVTQAIEGARPISPAGGIITGLSDLPPQPPRRLYRVGIDKLDMRMAFEPGTLSVLTGKPGQGKSTFATWLCHMLSRRHNIRCGVLMMETNAYRIRTQLALLSSGRDVKDMGADEAREVLAKLDQRFRVMQRESNWEGSHDMSWLKAMVRAAALEHECKFIVIDPWNELEHEPRSGESLTNYINVALAAIRQWAERYDVHIMVTAHPRKMINDDRPPVGYDIADSAAWVNKPSIGLTIHRDDTLKLVNWKVRDRETYACSPGVTEIEFDPFKLCYRTVA